MSTDDPQYAELTQWLIEEGRTPVEIEKILAKVAEYDAKTLHESIFDSINKGDFDLASIIDEALGGNE